MNHGTRYYNSDVIRVQNHERSVGGGSRKRNRVAESAKRDKGPGAATCRNNERVWKEKEDRASAQQASRKREQAVPCDAGKAPYRRGGQRTLLWVGASILRP